MDYFLFIKLTKIQSPRIYNIPLSEVHRLGENAFAAADGGLYEIQFAHRADNEVFRREAPRFFSRCVFFLR
jgi:hypothetical protein